MSRNEFTTVVVLAVVAGGALLVLPIVVAILRDIEGKADVLLLVLLLGWTGVAWACALVLALTRRRRQAEPEAPRRVTPRHDYSRQPYHDGVYLVSSGGDSNTWAVHAAGVWRIVYEVAGVERLVGPVPESDVPLGVLAEALRPSRV
jgi:hypothetical protein